MSWYFNKTDERYVTMADNAALTLPDGDWTISGWAKIPDNSGTLFKFWVSWGTISANPSINIYSGDSGNLWLPSGDWVRDDINGIFSPDLVYITENTWHHLLLQRSGTTVTLYIDNTNTSSHSLSAAVNVTGAWYWGIKNDLNAYRRFKGYLAEWAKWNRALNETERGELAAGAVPSDYSTNLSWYVPMYDDFTESTGTLTLTNNDVTAHSEEHPFGPPEPTIDISATIAGVGSITGTVRVLTGEEISATIAGVSTITATASGTQASPTVKDSELKILTRLIAINNDCLWFEDV